MEGGVRLEQRPIARLVPSGGHLERIEFVEVNPLPSDALFAHPRPGQGDLARSLGLALDGAGCVQVDGVQRERRSRHLRRRRPSHTDTGRSCRGRRRGPGGGDAQPRAHGGSGDHVARYRDAGAPLTGAPPADTDQIVAAFDGTQAADEAEVPWLARVRVGAHTRPSWPIVAATSSQPARMLARHRRSLQRMLSQYRPTDGRALVTEELQRRRVVAATWSTRAGSRLAADWRLPPRLSL